MWRWTVAWGPGASLTSIPLMARLELKVTWLGAPGRAGAAEAGRGWKTPGCLTQGLPAESCGAEVGTCVPWQDIWSHDGCCQSMSCCVPWWGHLGTAGAGGGWGSGTRYSSWLARAPIACAHLRCQCGRGTLQWLQPAPLPPIHKRGPRISCY